MQVRKLIASDAAALARFNSCLLESYVEVRHAQHLCCQNLPQPDSMELVLPSRGMASSPQRHQQRACSL